jgi:large subunit ribosomal protein L25
MSELELNAKHRKVLGKQVKALRSQGLLPAVLYGTGIDPMPLELITIEANKVLSGTGGSTLLSLKVNGDTHQVLVREIQRDVIRGDLQHIDFLKVAMDVTIKTEVPIELIGEAPAVNEQGGLLVAGLSEIEVEALPADLPDRITVDVSVLLEIDDSITVAELKFGENVEVLSEQDEIVAHVIYQPEEIIEEEEEVEEVIPLDMEPEVIEKGKREVEEPEELEED